MFKPNEMVTYANDIGACGTDGPITVTYVGPYTVSGALPDEHIIVLPDNAEIAVFEHSLTPLEV